MPSSSGRTAGRLVVETSEDGAVLRIAMVGEADKSNVTDLETLLRDIAPDGHRRVQLDLARLDFLDVAALRHLTLFALRMRQSGHEVRTHGAQPSLRRIVQVVGAQEDLGLE